MMRSIFYLHPLQASVYTTAILFALSQELSRIGVHCVHRHVNFLFLGSARLDALLCAYHLNSGCQGYSFFNIFVSFCHSDILLELIDQIFAGILDCYQQLLCLDGSLVKKLPQDAALQLMFDVKFLSNVLHPCSREQVIENLFKYSVYGGRVLDS